MKNIVAIFTMFIVIGLISLNIGTAGTTHEGHGHDVGNQIGTDDPRRIVKASRYCDLKVKDHLRQQRGDYRQIVGSDENTKRDQQQNQIRAPLGDRLFRHYGSFDCGNAWFGLYLRDGRCLDPDRRVICREFHHPMSRVLRITVQLY